MVGKMKWLAEAILLAAAAFLKAIPAIGFAPWACALVDAAFLVLMLNAAQRDRKRTVFLACALMPVFDWLQGAVPGYWIPFMALGHYCAAGIWAHVKAHRAAKVFLSAFAAYALRTVGVAFGYLLLRQMGFGMALRSVVINSWFVFAWYIALTAVYAAADVCRVGKKTKNALHC